MGKLKVNQNAITAANAEMLKGLCPFGAISYDDGKINISSACKMCKLCAKKSGGLIEYVEEEVKNTIDKSLWRGVCVFANVEKYTVEPDSDGEKGSQKYFSLYKGGIERLFNQ